MALRNRLLWLPIFLLAACHPQPSSAPTHMAESKIYIVSAKVVGIRQQDLSKMRGKVNMYTYLDLQILESKGKADPAAHMPADTCHITRRAIAGDETIHVGDQLQLELGMAEATSPQYATWIKRLD